MGKEQKIKKRIRTVRNINQITKAMEMTAASKLRRAQEATLRSRTYAAHAREVLAELHVRSEEATHPLFAQRNGSRRLIIAFTSDRGLAGAYNSNVLKTLFSLDLTGLKLIVIGQKGAQFAHKLQNQIDIVGVYTNWPVEVHPTDIRPIAVTAMELFTSRQVDRVSILYTDFESTIRQVVRLRDILPIDPSSILPAEQLKKSETTETLFEPSPQKVLNYVVPRLVEVQIYQASLEATASEHAARMVAMKNASDNAKDLASNLNLSYNSARQAAVTQELAEISAGAEVVS